MTAVPPTNSGGRKAKQGTQGLVLPVLRNMGRQCPIGLETHLFLKLDSVYPGLGKEPSALEALLEGLTERFRDQGHKV
jgi:hypothetical protein